MPAFSTPQQFFQMSPAAEYQLPAKEPQVFSNIFRWTINAECVVLQSDEVNPISFKILRKEGTVNDITLSKGEALRIDVHPDDIFHVIAVPGSSVELTNEGETTIITRCSTVSDTPSKTE